jgi:transcriptional regulator with XRE-family HTH domain
VKSRPAEVRAFLRRFGAAVRAERVARGLSQEDLGFEAGLDRTYVSGVERGVRNPTVATIFVLAKALRVRASRLVTVADR